VKKCQYEVEYVDKNTGTLVGKGMLPIPDLLKKEKIKEIL
jgi:hypothetical protein